MLNRHYVRVQRAVKRQCWVLGAVSVGSALNEATVLQNAQHLCSCSASRVEWF